MTTLDLHGIRHEEVDRIVENFIYLNQNTMPLTIICGHSLPMVKLVEEVTNRIKCDVHSYTFGTIIIRKLA